LDVWLPYGRTEVCVRIPARNLLGVISPKEMAGAPNPTAEIEKALHEPIGTPRLSEIAKPGDRVAIVVDDKTRAAPSHLMVPPILRELERAGVREEDVTIIFACGGHDVVTREEMGRLVGEEIIRRVNAISHDCRAEDQVYLGTTRFGTPVYVNRTFAEADVKILTGDVELHYFAGYGGGRKSVLPGVSAKETIERNHRMILQPNARAGVLEGNPVHEDMMEAARLAGVDFILNVVMNSRREVVRAFAGDLEKAFYEGVRLVDEMYKVPIHRRADIVVVSAGGYPFDINLYQAYKGIDAALNAVKRNGIIILTAECPEGYGNQTFYEWMSRFKGVKELERQIKRKLAMGGHKAYFLRRALKRATIYLVSVMPDYYAVNVFGFRTAKAVNDAFNEALSQAGRNAKVWVIPHGHSTLPVLTPTSSG